MADFARHRDPERGPTSVVWDGAVRYLLLTFLVFTACKRGPVTDLSLAWRGVSNSPRPSPEVAGAFANRPFMLKLVDARPDPTVVGGYDDSDVRIRTRTSVAEYCTLKMGAMLTAAGARLNEPSPPTVLETELLEYNVIEGGAFNGMVAFRATLRGGHGQWSKMYTGKSIRWGRTHNPENMNEALSNALADATQKLVSDPEFARALSGG